MEKMYRGFAIWEEEDGLWAEEEEEGFLLGRLLGPFLSVEEAEEEIDYELDGEMY